MENAAIQHYEEALTAARAQQDAAYEANDPEKIREANSAVVEAETALNNANAALGRTRSQIDQTNRQLDTARSAWTGIGQAASSVGSALTSSSRATGMVGRFLSTAITAPVTALGTAAMKTSIDFDSSFAAVRKTVNGTEEDLAKLAAASKEMSTQIATSTTDINHVMSTGGQLGIATEHIEDFTRVMIDLEKASTDLDADTAATQLAKFANIMGTDQSLFSNMGSVVAELGNNFATTEAPIVEMAMRIAGAGKQAGLTEAQVLGLAASLSSVGIQAQAGGSSISKALINMEVATVSGGNDYLPGRVRVLSSTLEGKAEPDLVSNPFEGGLTFTEQEQDTILRFKDENRLDELFRMLFIMECQSLYAILPGLFEKKEVSWQPRDYYALLLNINFTDRDGLVWHLTHDIPERDFRVRTREDDLRQAAEGIPEEEMPAGQVEIIGWLYQYYNTEPKNEVFAGLKKNKKIGSDDIPAATQLFTPDWIVRYMVQNSLGRLWVEGHPDTKERFMPQHNADGSVCVQEGRWNYYLEEAPQEPQVEAQLQAIREEYARLRPEDIKVIDPCCGSGHIAVYLFDVLMQIYETQGWTQREAAQSIVEHNLYALDIDDRAAQLAYFAVMMKARQYDRRFFTRGLQPHVYAIPEWDEETRKGWSAELRNLCNLLRDGKEFGSIIDMPEMDWNALRMEVELMADMQGQISIDSVSEETRQKLRGLIDVGQAMAQKYDVVVTNPPYMAITNANRKLFDFVKSNYTIGNSDMFGVFIERCINILRSNGLCGMITQNSWMFLSSYEKMRREISKMVISSMAHLGARAFNEISGEVVQTTAFVLVKQLIPNYKSVFERLIAENSEEEKEYAFLTLKHHYISAQDDYAIVPGQPIVYWLSHRALQNFTIGLSVNSIGAFTGQQNITADNEKYLRNSWEVRKDEIGNGHKWIFYIKGGLFRRWYGNIDFVVDWSEPAKAFYKSNPNGKLLPADLCFAEGITYTEISSGANSFRYLPPIGAFDKKGPSIVHLQHQYYCLGFFNSCVAAYYFNAINPTISLQIRDVKNTPVVISDRYYESVNECVRDNISICKTDWDSFEPSWDFQRHPLLDVISRGGPFFERGNIDLAECWLLWKRECEERFQQLKSNEEELNRIFIDIYGLQDELTPEVEDKDVTVRRADLGRDIRSLISYTVGCMFGRYSLDVPGLVYAGGAWDAGKYHTYLPDDDNCLPITDEDYGLKDDVVNRFVDFVRTVYGEATLEENLDFIARALGNKGDTSRDVIRNYFLNDFFKDHCQTYSVTGSGKRPIYWLFDSGKANGFKALVYMHRWTADTVGNLRVEYLHRMQRVYEKEIERMQDTIDNARDSREVARATKRREKLVKQLKEARDYDAKIAHVALSRVEIDLDDGVKVNYEKVQKGPDGKSLGILAKI